MVLRSSAVGPEEERLLLEPRPLPLGATRVYQAAKSIEGKRAFKILKAVSTLPHDEDWNVRIRQGFQQATLQRC